MATYDDKQTAPLVRISEIAPSTESLVGVRHNSMKHEKPDLHLKIDRTFQRRESILSSQISLYIEKTKPNIPDGGWGWLVVLSAFAINMISDGVGFTFGLLYIEFLNEFGASKSTTSWIGSLFMSIPLLAGPIGSALVDKYGCQSMTIIGGLVSTIGFILSAYVKSIGVMFITFGVIGGLGLMLCFVTAVVSIAFWFEKRRSIALGLAASGTGFGTIVFSPLSTFLLFEFGWRGTLLIIAGFFLNMCVCGALMRDPEWIIEEEKREKQLKKAAKNASNATSKRDSLNIAELKESLQQGNDTQYLLQNIDTCMDLSEKNRFKSAVNLPTFLKQNEKVPLEVIKQLSENKQLYSIILENYPNLLSYKSTSEKGLNVLHNDGSTTPTRIPLKFSMKLKKTDEPPAEKSPEIDDRNKLDIPNKKVPLFRSFSLNKAKGQHSYLRNIRFRRNSIGYRGAMLNIHKYKLKASSCPNIYRNSMTALDREEEEVN